MRTPESRHTHKFTRSVCANQDTHAHARTHAHIRTWEMPAGLDRPVSGGVEPVIVPGRQVRDAVEERVVTWVGQQCACVLRVRERLFRRVRVPVENRLSSVGWTQVQSNRSLQHGKQIHTHFLCVIDEPDRDIDSSGERRERKRAERDMGDNKRGQN